MNRCKNEIEQLSTARCPLTSLVLQVAGSYKRQVSKAQGYRGRGTRLECLLRTLFMMCLPSRLVPTTRIRTPLNTLSLPVSARSQHIHLNCHLLDPASSRKPQWPFQARNKSSCALFGHPVPGTCSLLTNISRPRSAHGSPHSRGSAWPFTSLHLFQLLSKINVPDILSASDPVTLKLALMPSATRALGHADCCAPLCTQLQMGLLSLKANRTHVTHVL